jgi:hypothetical protein
MAKDKQKGAVAIQKFLADEQSTLSVLYQRMAELKIFQEKLKAKLPPPLRDHFTLANINESTLTIHTDSPAWAARFRFLTSDILNHAQQLCGSNAPTTIRIKVLLPVNQSPIIKQAIKLSNKNSKLILETANSITDPVLKDALKRLSQNKS